MSYEKNMQRTIGFDLDNTIVCYDNIFWELARDKRLIPCEEGPLSKAEVREWLHKRDRADDFTRLQGLVYGPELHRAKPFPGVLDFICQASALGWRVVIVSHKTRYPALGEPFELHNAARDWLQRHGLWNDDVFFEPTIEKKIKRLTELTCAIFIDDLAKVLQHHLFPATVNGWLFDPGGHHVDYTGIRLTDWSEAKPLLTHHKRKGCDSTRNSTRD